MGGAEGFDETPDSEPTPDTAVHPMSLARAVRRASLLAGLVPLADTSEEEVEWVFRRLVDD